ncbi:MAG: TipAS antibiotic-recognition domain-containing protein [Blautia hansenii]
MLHKNWLGYTWKEYSAQAHKGLAAIYTADSRFQEYYDREQKGCAEFLIKAVEFWAGK